MFSLCFSWFLLGSLVSSYLPPILVYGYAGWVGYAALPLVIDDGVNASRVFSYLDPRIPRVMFHHDPEQDKMFPKGS